MKRVFIPMIFLISLSIATIANPNDLLESSEALDLGIDRYLKFLWMVDGAFNNERFKEEFTVNNNKLKEEDKVFTCKYKNTKSRECAANNFEEEFKKLFSKNINYEDVYTDKAIYSWISYKDGKYIFKNLDNCNIDRMGINHNIRVVNITSDKIIYRVFFENRHSHLVNKRKFELAKEDNDWKISTASYYDLCGMRYSIH